MVRKSSRNNKAKMSKKIYNNPALIVIKLQFEGMVAVSNPNTEKVEKSSGNISDENLFGVRRRMWNDEE